jgi:hypothetical protein
LCAVCTWPLPAHTVRLRKDAVHRPWRLVGGVVRGRKAIWQWKQQRPLHMMPAIERAQLQGRAAATGRSRGSVIEEKDAELERQDLERRLCRIAHRLQHAPCSFRQIRARQQAPVDPARIARIVSAQGSLSASSSGMRQCRGRCRADAAPQVALEVWVL